MLHIRLSQFLVSFNILTRKLGFITTPSMEGPKSTLYFGGLNLAKSWKGLFLIHSYMGSWVGELDDFPCELSLLIVDTGEATPGCGTWELELYKLEPAGFEPALLPPPPVPPLDKLTDEEEPPDEQFKDWAKAAAEALGSDTRAQGAYDDPDMSTLRWNKPETKNTRQKSCQW